MNVVAMLSGPVIVLDQHKVDFISVSAVHQDCTGDVECNSVFVLRRGVSAVQSNKVEGRKKSFLGVFGLTPRKNSNATSVFSGGRTSRPQTPPTHS